MLVKVKMKASGACRTGSRKIKNRKGCWKKRGGSMGKKR